MFTRKSACRRRALLIAPFSPSSRSSRSVPAGLRGPVDRPASPRPTIVLVHGDWADGSSWTSVIERLQRKGFTVVAPPNLLRGPATDAPYLASYLESIPGPIVLVAHSYGGFVATNAATGNDNVKALVYIDAFAPDEGETAGELVARGHSCVDEDAFNLVPYDGGVDLYLRWEANVSYPGFPSASPTASIARRPPFLPPCSGPRDPRSSPSPPGLRRGRRSRHGHSSGRWTR